MQALIPLLGTRGQSTELCRMRGEEVGGGQEGEIMGSTTALLSPTCYAGIFLPTPCSRLCASRFNQICAENFPWKKLFPNLQAELSAGLACSLLDSLDGVPTLGVLGNVCNSITTREEHGGPGHLDRVNCAEGLSGTLPPPSTAGA